MAKIYKGEKLTDSQYEDLIKTASASVIRKLYHKGVEVRVGDVVDKIMSRSQGAERGEVLSVVYEEFRKFVNAQPKGSYSLNGR